MEKYNKNFKAMVKVPNMVTSTFFGLPCVQSIIKSLTDSFVAELKDVKRVSDNERDTYFAFPGDWLGCDEKGQWWLIKKHEE